MSTVSIKFDAHRVYISLNVNLLGGLDQSNADTKKLTDKLKSEGK